MQCCLLLHCMSLQLALLVTYVNRPGTSASGRLEPLHTLSANDCFLRIAAAYPVLVARQIPPMRCASRDEIIGLVLPPKTLVIVIRAERAARDVQVGLRFDSAKYKFAPTLV